MCSITNHLRTLPLWRVTKSVCQLGFVIPSACWIPILYPNIPAVDSIGSLLACCNSRGTQCEAFSQGYYFHNHFNCTCLIYHVFICTCSKGMQFNFKIFSDHCDTDFTWWKTKTIKWIIRFSEFCKQNWNFAWRRNNRSQGSLAEYFKEKSCKSWVKHIVPREHLVNCSDHVMRWHKDQENNVWEPGLTGEEQTAVVDGTKSCLLESTSSQETCWSTLRHFQEKPFSFPYSLQQEHRKLYVPKVGWKKHLAPSPAKPPAL